MRQEKALDFTPVFRVFRASTTRGGWLGWRMSGLWCNRRHAVNISQGACRFRITFFRTQISSINGKQRRHRLPRIPRVGRGAWVMGALLIITSIPDLFFNRSDYKLTFSLAAFAPYLIVALLLIPMQTSAEEVFYRGWIQQWLDNGRRSIWVISAVNGALFSLPHLANPEVNGELILAVIGYGATGFMFSWVTFRDRSMEIALGAHAANNILAGLVVTSSDSALPAASIWTTPAVSWGPAAIISILMVPFFIWLTRKPLDTLSP